jgi:hypothetical protein
MELESAVLQRISGLEPAAAVRWLAGHGLLGLARSETLPHPVRTGLRPLLRVNAVQNLHLVKRFREIVDVLAGIPVCPLKGVFLLDRIYRHEPESRVIGDLDLLVPEGSLPDAVDALERAGLRESAVSLRLGPAAAQRELHDEGGLLVELHARLSFKHGIASTWDDLAPVPAVVHSRDLFALDRETTLVHLVTHLVRHRPLSRLRWVEDVLRWQEGGLDAERTLAVARRLGAHRTLIAGTRVLRRAFGSPGSPDGGILPGVPSSAGWPGQAALLANERLLWRDLGETLPREPSEGSRLGRTLSALLLADSLGDAVAFLRAKSRAGLAPRPTAR